MIIIEREIGQLRRLIYHRTRSLDSHRFVLRVIVSLDCDALLNNDTSFLIVRIGEFVRIVSILFGSGF